MISFTAPIPGVKGVLVSNDGFRVEIIDKEHLLYIEHEPRTRIVVLERALVLPPFLPEGTDAYSRCFLSRATRWSVPETEPLTDQDRQLIRERLLAAFAYWGFQTDEIV